MTISIYDLHLEWRGALRPFTGEEQLVSDQSNECNEDHGDHVG